jgi:hypothetical protein
LSIRNSTNGFLVFGRLVDLDGMGFERQEMLGRLPWLDVRQMTLASRVMAAFSTNKAQQRN